MVPPLPRWVPALPQGLAQPGPAQVSAAELLRREGKRCENKPAADAETKWAFSVPVLLPNPGESLLVLCLPQLASVAGLNELSVVCSFIEHSCASLFSLYLKIKSDFRSVPNSELLVFLT